MKTIHLFLFAVAMENSALGAVGVFTNVNGMVLGLELASTSAVAGERLWATMSVSNASTAMAIISYIEPGSYESDTGIGRFVVIDEYGNPIPRTVPARYAARMGSKGGGFGPGRSQAFGGDVVASCSLTNPGNYFIKAVANVPLTNDVGSVATFEAETPWVPVTVTARPANSPPAEPLYPVPAHYGPKEMAMLKQLDDVLEREQAMVNAAIQRAAMPRMDPSQSPFPLPQNAQKRVGNGPSAAADGIAANQEAVASASRNVLFAVIALLLSGGLALYLWWSRRKHGHS